MARDEITQAVKEALDDKRLDDLSKQMTELATQMAAGFAAVHTRQDTTNGKVLAHQTKFDKLEGKEGYDKLVWLMLTTLVGMVVYLIK